MYLNPKAVLRSLFLLGLALHFAGSLSRADADRWMNIGPDTGAVLTMAVDPSQPGTIYAGTFEAGVYKTTDGGASWVAPKPEFQVGVSALVIDPQNPRVLFSGNFGGVFKSTDGGASWFAINNGLDGTSPICMALDPSNSNVIYAATDMIDSSDQERLFKSTNGGASWVELDKGGQVFFASAIVVDPSTPNTIYIAAVGGVYKSTDGGASWASSDAGITDGNVYSIAIDPSRPRILYAGTSEDGVFMSIDRGASWQPVNDGLPLFSVEAIAVDPANPSRVYIGTGGDGVFKREFRLPEINSAVFAAPKKLTITGRNLDGPLRVFINDVDRTDFVVSISATEIQLKGKAKKLKLKSGDNRVQVLVNGVRSNVVTVKR